MHLAFRHRPALWQLMAGTGIMATVAYNTVLANAPDAQNVVYSAVALLGAAGALVAAVRRHQHQRRAWWLYAAGLAGLWLGDLIWNILAGFGDVPYPSISDFFYLTGYVCVALGVWWICARRPSGDREGSVDAIILSVAGGLVLWVLFIGRAVTTQTTLEASLVSIAYPMFDVAIIGIVARVLLGTPRRSFAVRTLMVGIVCYFVSDVVYAMQALDGTYTVGIVDAGWMLGYTLMGVAAAHPSSAVPLDLGAPVALFSRWRLALLAGASLLAPAIAFVQLGAGDTADLPVAIGCSVLLFVLVILRMDGAFSNVKAALLQRSTLEDRLRHQAFHDPLTGLGNRALLVEELAAGLAGEPDRVAVILIDLDDFKSVNDTLGHQAGDALLGEVGNRLSAAFRPTDLVARLGGDEFAISLRDASLDLARSLAQRALRALRPACEIDGQQLFVDASVGVAIGGPGIQAGDLLRDADIAMYLAKSQGKGRVECFEPTMGADVLYRVQLRTELEAAIAREELVLEYQPIVALSDGRVCKLEALVRWAHPVRGLIAPAEFIPLAETTGLIVPLGRWVLREACRRAAAWNASMGEPVGITVNVAALQLRHPAFVADVGAALRETGLAPTLLTLELTESAVLELETAARTLGLLKRLGVHLAIDDFGTGYSSLSYLAALPIDVIKIDRSFVMALGAESGAAIASTIVAIGHSLHVETVAEGIEEPAQLELLRALGCGFGQGFLFFRPIPAGSVAAILAAARSEGGAAAA